MSRTADGPSTSAGGIGPGVGALYLHVPFCVKRCAYCDFTSSTLGADAGERTRAYARRLSSLVGEAASLGLLADLRTAYVGGGTPTILGERMPGLIDRVVRSAGRPLDELTFEANPDSSSGALFASCREAGATRVSVGVQSTDAAVLEGLGRVHSVRQALEAIGWARSAGLRVSADLMAGVPGQGPGSLARDVERLAGAGVDHGSVYALEVHEATPFGVLEARGRLGAPDEDATADLLEEAERALGAAGFERYEVSNYARPGERSLHNLAYWTGVEYLGLGPSAASMLTTGTYRVLRTAVSGLPDLPAAVARVRLTCVSTIDGVLDARGLGGLAFAVEGLTERQALAEDLMLAARLADGLPAGLVARARAVIGEALDATIGELVEDGLLVDAHDSLRPTERGWLMGNVLYGALWDLAGDSSPWTPPT